ncbi:MAG: hypothetical protein U9N33_04400 [Campylobacterota bacterium]|nr:hypothetical protein [Campylobacterota bacterium]
MRKKILFILLLLNISLNADSFDSMYACIAFEKNYGDKAQRLDMKQSVAKGGYFRFSVKINFLRAIIYRDKDTINNTTYEEIRFAYRATVKGYDMYVYDYNKDYFLIEKGDKIKPRFSLKLENGDWFYYKCMMYIDAKEFSQPS